MTDLWNILGTVLSSLGDVSTVTDAYKFRRGDDKPARRRLVTPSDALPAGGGRVSQPLSLFRRSRSINSAAAAEDGKHPLFSNLDYGRGDASQSRKNCS